MRRDDWVTVPNVLGAVRLLGSPWLVLLGMADRETAFLVLFLFLTFTDWIDGKLAGWLDQRSRIGPRLDTLADVTMYVALLVGLVVLEGDLILDEWPWIVAGCASYLLSVLVAAWKFGTVPSYHTRAAKVSWLLALVAALVVLLADLAWPLRIAAGVVVLTNLEAVAITARLDRPREDVASILELAGKEARGAGANGGGPNGSGG